MKGNSGLILAIGVFVLLAVFAAWLAVDSGSSVKPIPAASEVPILVPINQQTKDVAVLDMQRLGFLGAYWDATTLVVPANKGGKSLEAVGIAACRNLRAAGYRGPADVQLVDRVAILNKTLKQLARVRCR